MGQAPRTGPFVHQVPHIANWLEVLKNDTRFIFKAAAHAQRAADYLRAFCESMPPPMRAPLEEPTRFHAANARFRIPEITVPAKVGPTDLQVGDHSAKVGNAGIPGATRLPDHE